MCASTAQLCSSPATPAQPRKTLFDLVVEPWAYAQRKHDLGEHYVANNINALTNLDLLQAISDAIETIRSEP